MSDTPLFLTEAELVQLTGRRSKSYQIAWLRENRIAFRVNAIGHPVVTRGAVEGNQPAAATTPPRPKWKPKVVGG